MTGVTSDDPRTWQRSYYLWLHSILYWRQNRDGNANGKDLASTRNDCWSLMSHASMICYTELCSDLVLDEFSTGFENLREDHDHLVEAVMCGCSFADPLSPHSMSNANVVVADLR